MRVLVCGGRDFTDKRGLELSLDQLHADQPITCLIHGWARGAVTLAGEWAWKKGIPVRGIQAEWGKYGKAAGGKRNQKMLDEEKPDLVVAFAGGVGTADMVQRAELAGVRVVHA